MNDLTHQHACFGQCWCEREPTDTELEDLSKSPLLEGLQRVAALKRESPRRIGSADANYKRGGWAS